MLCLGILGTGRDDRGQPYSRSHVLVDALDKARRASWLPCLAHQTEMNSLRGQLILYFRQGRERAGCGDKGQFLYPELEFQVRTEFVS